MLVLCRRIGESLFFGNGVSIEVKNTNSELGEAIIEIRGSDQIHAQPAKQQVQVKRDVVITHKRRSRLAAKPPC